MTTLTQLERCVGHPPMGIVNTGLAGQIVDLLNDLHRTDPFAMQDLIDFRVRCNDQVAAHPTVPVHPLDEGDNDGGALLGILGILNGLCGVWDEETAPAPHLVMFGPVCARFDDDGKLLGFGLSEELIKPR